MTVYLNEEGKVCVSRAITDRIQKETGYYIVSNTLFLRITALKKEDECFPPFTNEFYVIETYLTSKYRNLITSVYKFSNGKLTLLLRLDRPKVSELTDSMEKVGLHKDIISKLLEELELSVPAQPVPQS